MKVFNLHYRILQQPSSVITPMLSSLSAKNDMMLATDKWPRMRLDQGLVPGSKGGHGPIRYTVSDYREGESITFTFDMNGFDGFHQFKIEKLEEGVTKLSHVIDMKTSGWAALKWILAIRWLHDAFIEDAFDRVEGYFNLTLRCAEWTWWVKMLRWWMSRGKK